MSEENKIVELTEQEIKSLIVEENPKISRRQMLLNTFFSRHKHEFKQREPEPQAEKTDVNDDWEEEIELSSHGSTEDSYECEYVNTMPYDE